MPDIAHPKGQYAHDRLFFGSSCLMVYGQSTRSLSVPLQHIISVVIVFMLIIPFYEYNYSAIMPLLSSIKEVLSNGMMHI
jgi:hypothetical protein